MDTLPRMLESLEPLRAALLVGTLVLMLALLGFGGWDCAAVAQLQRDSPGLSAISVPWDDIFRTSIVLALGAALFAGLALRGIKAGGAGAIDWQLLAAMVGLAYFAYQALAGALFATTSIELKAVRDAQDPRELRVTLSVERGGQWLATIHDEALSLHPDPSPWAGGAEWRAGKLPRRSDGLLRLGPGEKTHGELLLHDVPSRAFYLSARVVSSAQYWPVLSQSLARVHLPAQAAKASTRQQTE